MGVLERVCWHRSQERRDSLYGKENSKRLAVVWKPAQRTLEPNSAVAVRSKIMTCIDIMRFSSLVLLFGCNSDISNNAENGAHLQYVNQYAEPINQDDLDDLLRRSENGNGLASFVLAQHFERIEQFQLGSRFMRLAVMQNEPRAQLWIANRFLQLSQSPLINRRESCYNLRMAYEFAENSIARSQDIDRSQSRDSLVLSASSLVEEIISKHSPNNDSGGCGFELQRE